MITYDLNEDQLRVLNWRSLCFGCGRRLGLHRYGTNQCPNTWWRPGNGQPQWRERWIFKAGR